MTAEAKPEEYVPGFTIHLSQTGLDEDAFNGGWISNSMNSVLGNFDQLKPVLRYREYFERQDPMYEAAGKPGLLDAVMQRSNLAAVAAFDKLADEFNSALPRIKEARDNEAVQKFLIRVNELRDELPDDSEGSKEA